MLSFLRENPQKSDPLLVRVLFKVFFTNQICIYVCLCLYLWMPVCYPIIHAGISLLSTMYVCVQS
jgi:hypothetical protein